MSIQDKKPDIPVSEDGDFVVVPTPEYVKNSVKEAIEDHAKSRNHPDATLREKGFVILSNAVDRDDETYAATSKAVKTAYDLANVANRNANNANDNANIRLSKEQNGADIPDKKVFVRNIGLENALKVGDYGVGTSSMVDQSHMGNMEEFGYKTGCYSYTSSTSNRLGDFGSVIKTCYNSGNHQMIIMPNYGRTIMYVKRHVGGNAWENYTVMTSNMWTVDDSGYYKTAPSVVIPGGSGGGSNFTTNNESEGATVEHLSEGIYLIKNVQGFNAAGVSGSIETPRCQNDLPLIWVNHEVLPDGSIKLMTYHREHTNVPAFARNIREGYADGDLIDIPDGRFVSVRVQMPEDSIWNQQQQKLAELK
ncbi:tail fiber protein [Xenorhabdus hominickii]|uniref:Tail protein n=1 Tax=Xenorhabdus hominickii TaxID=351679 RepID=A0A2G0Q2Z9_XENHO|nr:phage tail protein [Xenorhabdus hominickii]AOM39825.1 hypothetical protein A9255_04080 [Xenorhabdus hominickii]PHM53603.1 tail protein [Xenorhabdus hominickii]